MALDFFLCFGGFILLYYGAEWLVTGSSSLARYLGVTPVVIGLTVVAFGTSAPELVVSLVSSVQGKSMIAVGNVIGSNICNIALILGMAAMFQPITSHRSVVTRDIPIMLAVSFYLLLISVNSTIGRLEGATLFGGIILYTIMNYKLALKETARADAECTVASVAEAEEIEYVESRKKQIILVVVGIAGVIAGAEIVVYSAVNIMETLGVSEKFIGLTIVAFGTSLPELATSVVAAVRKEMDISIGNLVGSNVFNIMSVLGVASLVRPIPIPGGFFASGMVMDYIVMMFTSLMPLLMMYRTSTITRKDGTILMLCYFGYLAYLVAGV